METELVQRGLVGGFVEKAKINSYTLQCLPRAACVMHFGKQRSMRAVCESGHGQDDRWCSQFRITFCWMCTANPENSDNNNKIRNAIPLQLLIKKACWKIEMKHSSFENPFSSQLKFFFFLNTGLGEIYHWGKQCCFLVFRLNWLNLLSLPKLFSCSYGSYVPTAPYSLA